MSMDPASARRRVATTSRPTPRPEISVTMSRVEKPGSSVRRAISASVGMASGSSSPRSTARLRMSRRSRPRPSSATCTVTTWPRRATVSVMVPARGLPSAARSSGVFESMVDRIAQDVQQRIDQLIQHVGVDQDVLAHDDELSLLAGGGGGLAHVALQARHDGLHRRHARLRGEMRQFAHQALLLVQDAGEAGEFVLESDAKIARVGGLLDQRTRDRLHFVVLVEFQRIEVRWCVATACSLWRAATPRISTEFSSSNRRFWMARSLFDQFARMAGWRI